MRRGGRYSWLMVAKKINKMKKEAVPHKRFLRDNKVAAVAVIKRTKRLLEAIQKNECCQKKKLFKLTFYSTSQSQIINKQEKPTKKIVWLKTHP